MGQSRKKVFFLSFFLLTTVIAQEEVSPHLIRLQQMERDFKAEVSGESLAGEKLYRWQKEIQEMLLSETNAEIEIRLLELGAQVSSILMEARQSIAFLEKAIKRREELAPLEEKEDEEPLPPFTLDDHRYPQIPVRSKKSLELILDKALLGLLYADQKEQARGEDQYVNLEADFSELSSFDKVRGGKQLAEYFRWRTGLYKERTDPDKVHLSLLDWISVKLGYGHALIEEHQLALALEVFQEMRTASLDFSYVFNNKVEAQLLNFYLTLAQRFFELEDYEHADTLMAAAIERLDYSCNSGRDPKYLPYLLLSLKIHQNWKFKDKEVTIDLEKRIAAVLAKIKEKEAP